jgi:anhydro-N-acetylmuramic acid kinase
MFYKALGLMSGTSLDGLDMAYCEFEEQNGRWGYKILQAETITYNEEFRNKIISMEDASATELACFDAELGHYFGRLAKEFINTHSLTPDFVASHGQTIFHQPSQGYTTQIGNPAAICSEVKTTTIGDFRTLDVMLGGQGAPLVPIGDLHLFSDYHSCLNIGGFSNISHKDNNEIKAYDICPVNIVLNHLCKQIGLEFDNNGTIAANNKTDKKLLKKLNSLPYYQDKTTAKSLGKEWVVENIFPILQFSNLTIEEKIATYTTHAAEQIAANLKGNTLITGGGAYNNQLIKLIQQNTKHTITIADKTTIDYKEAMIFAFLGVLRMRNEINCLSSVTGASQSSCGGTIVQWIDTK